MVTMETKPTIFVLISSEKNPKNTMVTMETKPTIKSKIVVPSKNEEVQHFLDVLLSASMFSAELGEGLRKNVLSYAKIYDANM